MRVLREEPDFVAAIPAKVAPKPASLAPQQNGDGALKSSLYALLQLEKASEAAGGSRPESRQSRPEIADEKAHGPNGSRSQPIPRPAQGSLFKPRLARKKF